MNFKEVLIRLIAYTTPYVYDNNISLLELVRKLYKIVNELCVALQGLNTDYEKFKTDVEAEIDSFEADMTSDIQALKDYVDDYFDSLDVEQTIKDVLEEMTEDGTLEELLNQTVLVDINNHLLELDGEITGLDSRIDDLEADNVTNKGNITTLTNTIGNLSNLTTTANTDLVSAINEVDSESDTNASHIGILTNLTTNDKNNLVNAVNEVNSKANEIGVLANLNTTDKTSVVSAVNEVNTKVGDLTNLNTTAKNNVVSAINENKAFTDYMTLTDFRDLTEKTSSGTVQYNLKVALNSTGTAGKIYGNINVTNPNSNTFVTYTNTGIMGVTQEITISPAGVMQNRTNKDIDRVILRINPPQGNETSARISIFAPAYGNNNYDITIPACLYFFKDFGDVE